MCEVAKFMKIYKLLDRAKTAKLEKTFIETRILSSYKPKKNLPFFETELSSALKRIFFNELLFIVDSLNLVFRR